VPETGVPKKRHEDILTVEEINEIVQAAASCGIKKVRITGGEPLVRRGIIDICKFIAGADGISEVCLTTNGIALPEFASGLKAAGVNRLNISLDTLDRKTYNKITRTDLLEAALHGVDIAIKTGFDAIKINAVLIGGMNESDIWRLLDFTKKYKVDVRFIELMPIGECADWAKEKFVSSQIVLKTAPELVETGMQGVSKLYKFPDALGTVGLISPISSHFCPTCNRIRITADGILKPCLHSAEEINLRGLHGDALENVIKDAILGKPEKHKLCRGDRLPLTNHPPLEGKGRRNMNEIGG